MPRFVLLGKEARVFPDYGLLQPGDGVDAKSNPDPVWFGPAKDSKTDSKPTTTEGE